MGCGGYVVSVAEAMWLVAEAMCRVGNYSNNNTTSWPILQAEAFQIFIWAEISRYRVWQYNPDELAI